ncbi:uncharacterized protein LOC101448739 [Ceratitis capitata]|uniref:(Mediterranean fruit fly) hypothetical protein n=1 Tax=Ceratitis capitata TaxID=7213 RepID=W8CDL2_CERCA|nr:uncharacterized protein LOC101448739 [Ceratitis capitata]CAD7004916.1 unnamed protein product [Ceratitis capitata]
MFPRTSTLLSIIAALCFAGTIAMPLLDEEDVSTGFDNATLEELQTNVNDTPKNLYVVKAVVYEIGILTEVDDNETSFESEERVDLTFYDAHSNQSHINLGNVPLPIQTNISGQVLTGIAPVNIGAFSNPADLLQTLPLTGTIVNITHSNTAFYQLTKSNASDTLKPHITDVDDLTNVSNLYPVVSQVPLQRPTPSSVQSNYVES